MGAASILPLATDASWTCRYCNATPVPNAQPMASPANPTTAVSARMLLFSALRRSLYYE
jgi:hypothetical protein